MRQTGLILAATALAALAQPALAQSSQAGSTAGTSGAARLSTDPRVSLSIGASHWTGDYGAPTDSNISAILVGARYAIGGLRLTAAVPWMRIRSDGLIFTGIGATPLIVAPAASAQDRTRKGVGDVTLGAAYSSTLGNGFDLELLGRAKIPTTSHSQGVSTGKTDYAVGAEISKSFAAFAPFGSVTYRMFGDMPGWNLRNGFATSIGGSYTFSNQVVLVVSHDYARSASRFVRDSHEIVAGLSAPVTGGVRVTGFASTGLSQGASDLAGGVSLSTTF